MKTKKILSLLLSVILVLSMSISAMAADTIPAETDTATVTVKNVETGATVTLYQIVKPVYTSAGLKEYEAFVADSIEDLEKPTASEVSALAGSLDKLTNSVPAEENGSDYTAEVGAGLWLVMVEGTGANVYNPMIVSVNYDADSAAVGGTVDADTKWSLNDVVAYAKKGTPVVDKKIVDSASGNENGDDVKVGDTVKFEIDTVIPSYSEAYTNPVFKISDTLSGGFDPATEIVVLVGGIAATKGTDYILIETGNTFEITFDEDFIFASAEKNVVVTYQAVLNDTAAVNMSDNANTATIHFSNDPTNKDSVGTKTDETYTYTFAIDGILGGSTATESYKTHEIIKVGTDGNVTVETGTEALDRVTVNNPLAGAVFTLTKKDNSVSYEATSDENGYLSGFTGLDAGEYTLVEKSAPAGYVADTRTHSVNISAAYDTETGKLLSYTIAIDGTTTSTYTASYAADNVTIEMVEGTQATLTIVNTEIPTLPSTGGIGTTIFYVSGAVLVLGAIVLLITKKRMNMRAE